MTVTATPQPAATPDEPTLADVIRVVPERCHRNPTAKGLAYVARDFALYGLVVVALLATDTWWILIPLWLVAGALFASKRLNRMVARAAMLPAAHVREAWDLGHNRIHHGHTVQQGMDFVWHPVTVEEWKAMPGWQRLRHRVEWSAIGAGFYYGRQVWWNKMMRFTPPEKWAARIRRDKIEVLIALAVSAVAIGAIGWLQHDSIRWHQRRAWSKFKGQMEGTTILRTPRFMTVFFHNIFVHVPHHVDMRIPFYELPAAATAIRDAFPETVRERRLSMLSYLRTTRRCKLYDFERGVWLQIPRPA